MSDATEIGDATGHVLPAADATALSPEELRGLLRWMILARRLDRECIALQRQGELTVYPGFEGQEAAQVGSATALGPNDFVWPTFRELAAAIVRGVDAVQYLQYHRGTWHGGPYDPRATRFGPINIPIATQIPHAAGYALGQKLDGTDAVTLVYFGDGATSEGDFHEAANLAGVWKLPLVLFCQNNGWAISMPTAQQTAGEIWRRAEGYGFPGVRVDGNDVLAVREATRGGGRAGARRRGPDADRGDDVPDRRALHRRRPRAVPRRRRGRASPRRRPDRALPGVAARETALRTTAFAAACEEEAEAFAMQVRAGVIATPPPPEAWMFDWVYAEPPTNLARQRDEALG